jgi:hypothetical protein
MAKDLYHDLVKRALKKDGWEITHDPYELRVGGVEMYVDIGAEQIIGADRGNDKIGFYIWLYLILSIKPFLIYPSLIELYSEVN